MDSQRPRRRDDLSFFPVESEGRTVIMIQDQLGLVEKGQVISPGLYTLMSTLDGSKSVRDIQLDMMREQGGRLIPLDEIEALLGKLDSIFLLDSPRYRDEREKIISSFSAQDTRNSALDGVSYPEQKESLEERLEAILAIDEAPSPPPGQITGLVAPHIDLEAGKNVYSKAYQAIQGIAPKRIIILGVGHSMRKAMFSLTTKTFETPLGRIKTDEKIVTELIKAGNTLVSEDDFVHRDEHSIEFQLIFLQHILGDIPFSIVPILCGSLIECLPDYTREAYCAETRDFLMILEDVAKDDDTILIAGVDLSHVGHKFGHDMPASLMIDQSERHDRELLNCLCARDADHFWLASRDVQDRYNVCGFSALACFLETLPPGNGQLLGYEIFREAPTSSAVGFAAALFTSDP